MLFKTEFDQQSTVQKRSAKMVRGLENHVCRIRLSERVSYQCQMRQCFGFFSCPVVSCTQGRNGLSCLLWLYLQVSGVPSTSSSTPGLQPHSPVSIPSCHCSILPEQILLISLATIFWSLFVNPLSC